MPEPATAQAQEKEGHLDPTTSAFYRRTLEVLTEADIEFLVGGAYAFSHYTGVTRHTKDFDVFLNRVDRDRALVALSEAGFPAGVIAEHWLAKAFHDEDFVDIIYSSGNGVADVDDVWFANAVEATVFGIGVRLVPPEEMIWQKAYVMDRERYDGADVAHLLRACAESLDWERLTARFSDNWRALFSHLVLFGFIYPSERGRIPAAVMNDYVLRLQKESASPASADRVCRGTVLSRTQYEPDVGRWGFKDARLKPIGNLTAEQAEEWRQEGEKEATIRAKG